MTWTTLQKAPRVRAELKHLAHAKAQRQVQQSILFWHWMYALHDFSMIFPLFAIINYDYTHRSKRHCGSSPPHARCKPLREPRFNISVHHAAHWPQRWDRRLWKHTAHDSEALPWSRLPGNCCYATTESPIKVQCVAHWGWTAPQCSKYLWGALFTLKPWIAHKKERNAR